MPSATKTITIRITPALDEKLKSAADLEGRSRRAVIRRALESHLESVAVGDRYPDPADYGSEAMVSEPQSSPIKERSFQFALEVVRLYQQLQDQHEYVLSKQLLRSGTSIGANVEEATAAESRRDFLHKMKIAMKESRESHYWLRLIDESGLIKNTDLSDLLHKADELSRMLTSITKTTAENNRKP